MISEFDNSIDEIMYEDMIEAAADVLWDAINDFLNSPFHKFIIIKKERRRCKRNANLSPDDTDQIVEDAFKWLKKKKDVIRFEV